MFLFINLLNNVKGKTNHNHKLLNLTSQDGELVDSRELTSQDGELVDSRERIVARRVQDVQLVDLTLDLVNLPVEVLDRRRVAVIEFAREEPADDGGLADLG